MLAGKKILIGICGSIAAYKIVSLIRLLIKEGNEVRCIMTESATKFISPLTVSTISKNEVYIDYFKDNTWNNHVELGMWADVFLIAPTTANTLSKMANGASDNMLVATYLSSKCPVIIAPAMDLDMWHHPSTKKNLDSLKSYGNEIIPVGYGELASGLVGDGRLAEPEEIKAFIENFFQKKNDLAGKKILITAGPTFEHIDPVRFIGNHSTGKMGIALANNASERGADVHLVLGPTSQKVKESYRTTRVSSAQEMYEACSVDFHNYDIVIWSAAVADYKPLNVSDIKIKKSEDTLNLELVKNIDIAYTLGKLKKENQILVGFALETNNEENNALKKIHKKNLDFIVLNSLNDVGAGFGHDTNKITIIHKNGSKNEFGLKTKTEVADDILNVIINKS